MALRRRAYGVGLLRTVRVGRPVIVVGNITVGGTAKTPFTMWLATRLQARGWRVGIVLRGYGGQARHWPQQVTDATSWETVGDEAMLLATRTSAIVVAGPDRVADARRAIDLGAQVVLSDDGLQHYRLARDCEIAVIDAQRGWGNGRMLPAGPLREPRARLRDVDMAVINRRGGNESVPAPEFHDAITVTPRLREAISLTTGERRALESLRGARVHALAGVGHPQAFFDGLRVLGLEIDQHPFPDHARLGAADIRFADQAPVLMTEKDAVKCAPIADHRHWAVRLELEMSEADRARVDAMLDRLDSR